MENLVGNAVPRTMLPHGTRSYSRPHCRGKNLGTEAGRSLSR